MCQAKGARYMAEKSITFVFVPSHFCLHSWKHSPMSVPTLPRGRDISLHAQPFYLYSVSSAVSSVSLFLSLSPLPENSPGSGAFSQLFSSSTYTYFCPLFNQSIWPLSTVCLLLSISLYLLNSSDPRYSCPRSPPGLFHSFSRLLQFGIFTLLLQCFLPGSTKPLY